MKTAADESREALAAWRGHLAPSPHPDAPPPPPPPLPSKHLTVEQRVAQDIQRAKWRIFSSRRSPASLERKRIRDRLRWRRITAVKRGTPILLGEQRREHQMASLEKANEVKRLLKSGIDPRPRIQTQRTKPYSHRWALIANPPAAPRVTRGMTIAPSPIFSAAPG